MHQPPDCAICRKHRGEGPLVGPVVRADDLVVVSHYPADPVSDRAVPGQLFVETRRHVARWQHLTAAETAAVARAGRCAAQALAERFETEHVFAAIVGMGVAHFHQHVFVRHPGTPTTVPWHGSTSWPQAPTVSGSALHDLAGQLAERWPADIEPLGSPADGQLDHHVDQTR